MINGPTIRFFEFGPFRIDPRERMLLRNGDPVPITPKAFDILLLLVENRGHTLSKDELIERIWPDSFVEPSNLNRNVSTLRNILGEDSQNARFIKTFPKRGFRFDAEVKEVFDDSAASAASGSTHKFDKFSDMTSVLLRRKMLLILGGCILIAVASFAWPFARDSIISRSSSAAPRNPRQEAVGLYREARSLWLNRSGESLHLATMKLEQTIGSEPNFALAHAALADAYAFDTQNRLKAEPTARRAIELDPSLGEPHATIGFLRMFWEWKPMEAEQHFKTAVGLSPNYATAHQWYSINLSAIGEGNGALAEMKIALELDPDSAAINSDACTVYYSLRRFADAETHCRRALETDKEAVFPNQTLYEVYMSSQRYDAAVNQFFRIEEMVNHYSTEPQSLIELREAYTSGGIRAFWRKRTEMLERRQVSNFVTAKYHARLGEVEKTFLYLRRAYDAHELDFIHYLSEPLFIDCCYNDARYGSFPPFLPIK